MKVHLFVTAIVFAILAWEMGPEGRITKQVEREQRQMEKSRRMCREYKRRQSDVTG